MEDPNATPQGTHSIDAALTEEGKELLTAEQKQQRYRERQLRTGLKWVRDLTRLTVSQLIAIKRDVQATGSITSAQAHERARLRRRATNLCICRCTIRCFNSGEKSKHRSHGNIDHELMHVITNVLMSKLFEYERPDALVFDLCSAADVPQMVETHMKLNSIGQAIDFALSPTPSGEPN